MSGNTPNIGENILVTVNATDDALITSVIANGVSLTKESDDIWTGNIVAIEGTHSVNVSASDVAGHVTWDNSTSYTAAPDMVESISLVSQVPIPAGSLHYIGWDYSGDNVFEPNVTLELFKDGIFNRTIVSDTYIGDYCYCYPVPGGHNNYAWAIPLSIETGTYQIKIIGRTTTGIELTNTTDLEITIPTADGCKLCHSDPMNTHHNLVGGNDIVGTPYGCSDCHPMISTPDGPAVLYERNCLNCHNGTAFWANPIVIVPGEPHIDEPPVINSITLSTNTPIIGDLISVTVNTIDDGYVTSVMANDVPLTKQGNFYTWNGSITAIEGTHSVNVSAIDNVGHITWDNSTSYTATTPPNIIVTSPMTGDNWIRGTAQIIRWTYTGDLGSSTTVELLEQGRLDQTWTNVPQANGVGSLDWAIPSQFEVSTYQVRVSAGGLSNTTGNFNIVKR